MKRILSAVLSVIMAFAVFCVIPPAGAAPDTAVAAEAAESYKKSMLPYYYNQLSDAEKADYLKFRTAFINMKSSVTMNISKAEMDKLVYILSYCDVLTSFNTNGQFIYRIAPSGKVEKIGLDYRYSKENYNAIIKYADSVSEKVISKFSAKTSDYTKIRYIHDYIASKCSYDLKDSYSNNIYGALSRGKAKCDGYAHAFNYICTKAGIRTVTVAGVMSLGGESEGHAWNKVYYNKKWYNVDVTSDDSPSMIKDYTCYNYFMTDDKTMRKTHTEEYLGFDYPEAKDGSMNYYEKYGLSASTKSEAKKLLAGEIAKAADNGKYTVEIQMKGNFTISDSDISSILSSADGKSEAKLITKGCIGYATSDRGVKTYVVLFFRKGTKLSDYFSDKKKLSPVMIQSLVSLGLEDK